MCDTSTPWPCGAWPCATRPRCPSAMPTLVKTASKDFNPDRLREELEAAGLAAVVTSMGWAGFVKAAPRLYTPAATRRVVATSVSNGERTEDVADPGELRFFTTRDLTGAEDASLTTVLTAHVATQRSAEQVRQDQDEADLDALLATEFAAYRTRVTTWDTLNPAQKLDAARDNFVVLGTALRVLLRRERGAAL